VAGITDDPGGFDGLLRALLDGGWSYGTPTHAELVAAVDALPMAIWVATIEGEPVAVSVRWTELTGQSIDAWRAGRWEELIHPDDHERVAGQWQGFMDSGQRAWTDQYRIVHGATGELRVMSDRVVRIDCGTGALFVGLTDDITVPTAEAAEARRLGAKQDALQRVAEFVARRPDTAAVAEVVSREVAQLFGVDTGAVVRFEDDGFGLVAGLWSATPLPGLEVGSKLDLEGPHAAAEVWRTGAAARVRPTGADVLLPSLAERVAVPVRVGGRLWGTLSINSSAAAGIDPSAEERLARFAELVAVAISETEAREALQQRVVQQTAVNELSAAALAGGGVEDLFDLAIGQVADILAVSTAYIVESLGDGAAVARASAGHTPGHVGVRYQATPDTLTGASLAGGTSVVSDDFAADPRFGAASTTASATGMFGGACFVIRLPDRVWGMICVLNERRRVFTPDDLRFLEAVANVIGSAIERTESEQTIRHQAMHDGLTGIPNRTLLLDRLALAMERAERDGTLVGVICIDLDRFKDVNDSYGHSIGDAMLVAAAQRLSATLRPGDTIARVGGDEFAVVAEALSAPEEALALAERLLRAVSDPDRTLPGASVGVAVRRGGDSPEDAVRDADTALYRAKAAGRGRVELFDNEMRARMLDRLQTEADLRTALERREFDLHYQPIVALGDGSVVGVEGLVRWQHPTRGLIPPVTFIGIAEETGAIIELGRFVIARACADAARWNAMCPDAPPLSVNVNLSALQLGDAGLPDFIATSLAASGVPACQLGLEITESVVIDEIPDHVARLLAIKRLGVKLLLDDFGTGYSSFGHLRRFPLDVMKLDRSFVAGIGRDETDTAIVVATRQLARALGLDVVAEGVETREQLVSLQGIGCEFAQGYYFARPLTRAKVDRLIVADPPWRIDARRAALDPDGP
jgi:diguanylate cyclase (GGDEF)-like protein/PAS domain S-box-containing protein